MKPPAICSAAVRHNNDYGWCCGMKRPQKRKQLCIKVGASSDIGGLNGNVKPFFKKEDWKSGLFQRPIQRCKTIE